MRHFVYFSKTAQTSGNFRTDNLMKAGRMDIAIHTLINAFFLSHKLREDVIVHLVFYGMPDPPKHIEITIKQETGVEKTDEKEKLDISKKDVGNLIKKILYKYKVGEKKEVLAGCFIEKKSLGKIIEELSKENKVFVLDKKGKNIRDIKIPKNCVFVIGDHNGFPKKELKRLKKTVTPLSVGNKIYFASQVVTIINYELDLRGF